jgi:hypothetical protein
MGMARDFDSICARLAELEAERSALNEQLERLQAQKALALVCGSDSSITANSTSAEKITLFRRLFGGRCRPRCGHTVAQNGRPMSSQQYDVRAVRGLGHHHAHTLLRSGKALALPRRCVSMGGFKSFRTAAITLAGIKLAHRIRKKQFSSGRGRYRNFGSLKQLRERALAWYVAGGNINRADLEPNRSGTPIPSARGGFATRKLQSRRTGFRFGAKLVSAITATQQLRRMGSGNPVLVAGTSS